MSWRDAPLYVEVHDLARWVLERCASWEREPGRLLAAPVAAACCELVASSSLALTFPRRRRSHLEVADEALVRLRVLLRLAQDLGLLSPAGLRHASGRLTAAGRMVGGWRKRLGQHGGEGADEVSGEGLPAARTGAGSSAC